MFDLPNAESDPVDIAAGPDGSIWYTARGEGRCEGRRWHLLGPDTEKPGIVGHIVPGPLAVEILSDRAGARGRWAKVRLACSGGNADSVCRGKLRLSRRDAVLARASYELLADETRSIGVRLNRRALKLLSRHPRLRVKASIGHGASRAILLKR